MRSTAFTLPVVVALLHAGCGDSSESEQAQTGGSAGSTANGGAAGSASGKAGAAGSSTAGKGGSGTGGNGGSSAGGTGGMSTAGSGDATGSAGEAGAGAGAGAGGGAGTECSLGNTWELLDDFQLSAGEHSNPSAIAAAGGNRLFAVGVARMGTFQWTVRRSIDGGENWDNLDMADGGASDVAVDSNGVIFVVGTRGNDRIVRRSVNGGDDWTTQDTVALATTGACGTGSLAITSDDTVYVGGGCDSTGVTVRRSTNGGDSFGEVESFQYMSNALTRMGALGVDANDQVYVGGYGAGSDGTHWLVRRGTGMGTWTGADDYQLASGNDASLTTFGGRDAIYAAGYAADMNGVRHWIIRRAALDDPANFTTVDDVPAAAAANSAEAHSVYQAVTGELVAVGRSVVDTSPGRVIYRRSNDGDTWSDAGDFVYTEGADSFPAGRLVSDTAGNVYGMVRGVDADGFAHWIVRKLPCTN